MGQYSYFREKIIVWASLVGRKVAGRGDVQVLQQGSSSVRVEAVPQSHRNLKIARGNGLVSFRIERDVYWLRMYGCGMLGHKLSFDGGKYATVVFEILVKICQAKKVASHLTKILRRRYDFNLTTTIVTIMGRRLLDEVVHRIRLCVEANESVAAIVEAVKVSKKTIYKL